MNLALIAHSWHLRVQCEPSEHLCFSLHFQICSTVLLELNSMTMLPFLSFLAETAMGWVLISAACDFERDKPLLWLNQDQDFSQTTWRASNRFICFEWKRNCLHFLIIHNEDAIKLQWRGAIVVAQEEGQYHYIIKGQSYEEYFSVNATIYISWSTSVFNSTEEIVKEERMERRKSCR